MTEIKMTELDFKNAIWKEKEYFVSQCGYLPDENFFQPKTENSGTSNDYYIKTEALKEWAYQISKYYTPFNNDHALLIKDLLEQRGGQYSNGTLFSSSRLIAEMFKNDSNRKKLLAHIGLENYCLEDFTWYLEYRLPIFDAEQHPAQLDLAVVNEKDGIFIGVESKMKEIYSNHHNDFRAIYKEKLLALRGDLFELSEGSNDNPIRVTIKDCATLEYCNFYYKQQICHLLGMRKLKKEKAFSKCYFINFVFDIGDIPKFSGKTETHIKEYRDNEKAIMSKLAPLFKEGEIKYCGLITQKEVRS